MGQKYIIISMQRSGHHAIIFWLLENLGGYKSSISNNCYWNDETKVYYYNDCNHMRYSFIENYKYLFTSFEDIYACINRNSDDKIVIILRDFINMFASRYKKFGDKLGLNNYYLQNLDEIIKVWKQHAKTIIENYNNNNVIGILYNKWLLNKNYRDEICEHFGIKNQKDKIDYVPTIGEGSSFIGQKLEEKKENYLNRYKNINIPSYILIKIKYDDELIELNKILFNIDLLKELQKVFI